MNLVDRKHLDSQTGTALEISRGQLLRVTDPKGEQVSDLISFSRTDLKEWLSSGRTIDYANTIYPSVGHVLYSNRSNPMWTIVEDMVGRHDFLLTPCSPDTFKIIYGTQDHHPSCLENLSLALAPYGIEPDEIPTTLNIFMNVEVSRSGEINILPPLSKAGD
ncbi:MAG: urea carboxylase-associated family protein, partial [Gemmatimonadales bacterium]